MSRVERFWLASVRSFDSVLRCVPIQSAKGGHVLGLLLIAGSEVGSLVAALFSF